MGNQQVKGVKDCLITCTSIEFKLIVFFLKLNIQISISLDRDQAQNGQPPQILRAIRHLRSNGVSVLTKFVLPGFQGCTVEGCLGTTL